MGWAAGEGNQLGTCGNQAMASQRLTPTLTLEMRPSKSLPVCKWLSSPGKGKSRPLD